MSQGFHYPDDQELSVIQEADSKYCRDITGVYNALKLQAYSESERIGKKVSFQRNSVMYAL